MSTEMPVLDGEVKPQRREKKVEQCGCGLPKMRCPFASFFSEAQVSGPAMAVPRDLLCGGVKDGCLLDGGTHTLP